MGSYTDGSTLRIVPYSCVLILVLLLAACNKTEPLDTDGLNDRIYGMLMGSAVADALAGPHEGRSTEDSKAFLEEGGWINSFDTPYNRWYQSHWNVYEQGAYPGTYTDDSRLRLFVSQSMVANSGVEPMSKEYFVGHIFQNYQRSSIQFMDANKDVLKERFLEMWFWWELTKLATSVTLPEEPLLSPSMERNDLLNEQGERTGYWELVKTESGPIDSVLKFSWHDGSYATGKEWPIGQIALLPLAAYFPGDAEGAFEYVLDIDFLDIGNAPLYPAFMAALIADGLASKDWKTVKSELIADGLKRYSVYAEDYQLEMLESQVQQSLALSSAFQEASNYPSRENYISFVNALHQAFAVGTDYDMCTCEEMLTVSLAIADYSMSLGLQKAVEYGVNYGRDNDTVASFVATLVGAYRGIDDLNPEWIHLVKTQNPSVDIKQLSEKLSHLSTSVP